MRQISKSINKPRKNAKFHRSNVKNFDCTTILANSLNNTKRCSKYLKNINQIKINYKKKKKRKEEDNSNKDPSKMQSDFDMTNAEAIESYQISTNN